MITRFIFIMFVLGCSPSTEEILDSKESTIKFLNHKIETKQKEINKLKADIKECERKHDFDLRMKDMSIEMSISNEENIRKRCDCTKPIKIAFLGDSITNDIYPSILKRMLGARAQIEVFAENGATVYDMRKMIDKVGNDFTHIIIYGGTNDCKAGHDWNDVAQVLGEIHEVATSKTNYFNVYTIELFERTTACAEVINPRLNGKTIDTSDISSILNFKKYFKKDRVHLTMEGNNKLAQLVYERVNWSLY